MTTAKKRNNETLLPEFQRELAAAIRPPEKLTGSKWAIANAWFSPEDSAAKRRYSADQFPFQIEILDVMTDTEHEQVVFMAASQTGKTTLERIVQGYYIDQEPCPMLMIQPTLQMAEAYSKDRLSVFIRDCPSLASKINNKSRDSESTILHKVFIGGHLTIAGANSPASLASRPIRVLMFDEVDRYPLAVGNEGDPSKLGIARTRRFWNRKIISVSSPTITGISRILQEFEKSDRRYYNVPCPHCGGLQRLVWKNLRWDHDKTENKISNIYYYCEHCGEGIEERFKSQMVKSGKWIATAKSKIAGFHISELYILDTGWESLIRDFISIGKNRDQLQVFINTRLGEPFDDRGEAPDHLILYGQREFYKRGTVPEGPLFLTAAVDTQGDRLECEVVGWGRNLERWSIDHYIWSGDTEQQQIFSNLSILLDRVFLSESGKHFKIRGLGIDTGGGGNSTHSVYYWCRSQDPSRVYPLKGMPLDQPIGIPRAVDVSYQGKKITNGLKLWGIGVSILKSELYARLRLRRTDGRFPPGYIHYPDYPEEWFEQLTAEVLTVSESRTGKRSYSWSKIRERNEALDLAVYNRAVALILGIDQLTDSDWDQIEGQSLKIVKNSHQERSDQAIQIKTRRIISNGVDF